MENKTECCATTSCPFAFTEESEKIQNYGCLPTPYQIMNMRIKHGKTWACHSNPKKPCSGSLEWLKLHGHPYKVIDSKLVTEDDDWSIYVKPQN